MKLNPIITSLMEIDMYKLSMGQCIYHQFSGYKTTWTFHCRNKDVFFTPEMVNEIREHLQAYCALRFTEEELQYIDSIRWIKGSYVDFLRLWQPRYEDFTISTDAPCGLAIEARGSWLCSSIYEIPILAIINEIYFRMQYDYDTLLRSFEQKLDEKIGWLISGKYRIGIFSEFGLRRRLSAETQELAVKKLVEANRRFHSADGLWSKCVGTSNVYLAKKYGILPVGTQAHEFTMCVGQGNHRHNAVLPATALPKPHDHQCQRSGFSHKLQSPADSSGTEIIDGSRPTDSNRQGPLYAPRHIRKMTPTNMESSGRTKGGVAHATPLLPLFQFRPLCRRCRYRTQSLWLC